MRRLGFVSIIATTLLLWPAITLAAGPVRIGYAVSGGGSLVYQPASACLGHDGWWSFTIDIVDPSGKTPATVLVNQSDREMRARVHGRLHVQLWTTVSFTDLTPVYRDDADVRLNDDVTPNFPGADPPQGFVSHPLVFDMVPVAGGPVVPVATELDDSVIWLPDGTVATSSSLTVLRCT
jgi:hypothetical protein